MSLATSTGNDTWTGPTPGQWARLRLGNCFRERNESTTAESLSPLSVTKAGVVDQQEQVAKSQLGAPKKVARAGDFVINSRSDRKGSAGLAPRDGSVSVINIVLEPREIYPRFAHHLLRSGAFQEEFFRWGSGIVDDLWSTRYAAMKNIVLPVPPASEQRAIADYLDHETAEIDTLIADNQELIRLFNERRAAAIHAALEADYTRFVPLKHLGSLRSGIALGSRYDGELYEFPYLRVANVQTDHVDLHDVATVRVPRSVAVNNRLEAGDILMTEGGDRDKLGRGALWEGQIPDALHQNHIFSFRCGDELTPDYLVLVLESARARRYFDETARQSTNLASTNSRTVKAFEIPWRPVEEQARLVTALDSDIRDMRTATNDSHRAIELAQERHTALISAAVTGQIDVTQKHRPVAEQLEDEVKQLS